MLAIGGVVEEAFLPLIETCQRKTELVAQLVVVGYLGTAIEASTEAQADIRALIGEWLPGVEAQQSALGILSVERTLSATKHVDAVNLVGMKIKHRLADDRDIVDIESHGRTIHARTYTTHIHR